ncbi:MAG TPA: hypothetical protein PK689_03085, partial [Kiritimatiellia bacterium]|nr:hypothetical protein [Kiritimatiellia bacterium]
MEDQGLMIRCQQCGEMNRLPVVHCKKCGAKLDFEAAEKRMLQAGAPTAADCLRNVLRLAVALGLAAIVLLAIWPGRMTRTVGDDLDARRYRMKGELLIAALNNDMPASQVITEAEINAHFRELVAAQPVTGKGARLEDIGVRLIGGRAEAFVSVRRGPFTLTSHFIARPKGNRLVVTGARAGHLPLPGVLGRLY